MNHYEVLGIDESADRQQVRSAYLLLVQDAHPDRHVGEARGGDWHHRFKAIHDAYEVLCNPDLRAEYDRQRLLPKTRAQPFVAVTPVRPIRHDLPDRWLDVALLDRRRIQRRRGGILAILLVLLTLGALAWQKYPLTEAGIERFSELPRDLVRVIPETPKNRSHSVAPKHHAGNEPSLREFSAPDSEGGSAAQTSSQTIGSDVMVLIGGSPNPWSDEERRSKTPYIASIDDLEAVRGPWGFPQSKKDVEPIVPEVPGSNVGAPVWISPRSNQSWQLPPALDEHLDPRELKGIRPPPIPPRPNRPPFKPSPSFDPSNPNIPLRQKSPSPLPPVLPDSWGSGLPAPLSQLQTP